MNLPSGSRIAIDFGIERVGIASSDAIGMIASPVGTYSRDEVFLKLKDLASEQNIVAIYFGLPKHLKGFEGEIAELARRFAHQIQELDIAPIFLVDERLTSSSAQVKKELVGKFGIDAVAAQEILEFALNGERLSGRFFGEAI
jgi:putative Holliday junction resolvase